MRPLCLKVVGLPAASAAVVATRVKEIALAAGARVAAPGCRTDALIAFVPDGRAAVRDVAARHPASLQELSPVARRCLLDDPAPIRWWYATKAFSGEGDEADGGAPAHIRGEGSATGVSLPGNMDTTYQTVRGASFVKTESQRAIHASNVIVDATLLNGVGLDAATDFAAFVTLAEVRRRDLPQPDSILGLFAGPGASGRRLTEWDAVLLRELYRMPLDRSARLQRGALTAAVKDARKPR